DLRQRDPCICHDARYPRLVKPYYQRCDCGGWGDTGEKCGPLGRHPPDDDRVGNHDPARSHLRFHRLPPLCDGTLGSPVKTLFRYIFQVARLITTGFVYELTGIADTAGQDIFRDVRTPGRDGTGGGVPAGDPERGLYQYQGETACN